MGFWGCGFCPETMWATYHCLYLICFPLLVQSRFQPMAQWLHCTAHQHQNSMERPCRWICVLRWGGGAYGASSAQAQFLHIGKTNTPWVMDGQVTICCVSALAQVRLVLDWCFRADRQEQAILPYVSSKLQMDLWDLFSLWVGNLMYEKDPIWFLLWTQIALKSYQPL